MIFGKRVVWAILAFTLVFFSITFLILPPSFSSANFWTIFSIWFAISIFIALFTNSLFYINIGHRCSAGQGEYLEQFGSWQENSLSGLRVALQGLLIKKEEKNNVVVVSPSQDHPLFLYLEFDVQETKDHEIVVFHDLASVARVCERDDTLANQLGIAFEKIRIRDLTMEQVSQLKLKRLKKPPVDLQQEQQQQQQQNATMVDRIPTLKEWLQTCLDCGLRKPLVCEIKDLHSDQGKLTMLRLLRDFRTTFLDNTRGGRIRREEGFDFAELVSVLCWPDCYKRTFGSPFGMSEKSRFWAKKFQEFGFHTCAMPVVHWINLNWRIF